MEDWRQKTYQHQERRSKGRHKTKAGYINSLPLQTQLCSCGPHHKRRTVLFMSSRPWFLFLSCASNHMTGAHSDARQTAEVRMVDVKNTADRLQAGGCKVMSGGHGKWAGGASWDRTSTLSLCRREDPCLGLFVFSVLSPIPILPHPPNPTSLPQSWDSSSSELCLQTQFSHGSPSIFLPSTWPLTLDHSPTDGETLSPVQTHCYVLLLLEYSRNITPAECDKSDN